jgi:hypothetical protein
MAGHCLKQQRRIADGARERADMIHGPAAGENAAAARLE